MVKYPWLTYLIEFSGKFSFSILKSQRCCLKRLYFGQGQVAFFPFPFSNLVDTIVVWMFFSGKTRVFLIEIWPDLLMAWDTLLSMLVVFEKPKKIYNFFTKRKNEPHKDKNSKQQETKQEQKLKIAWPIILFIHFRIIFIKQARLFIDQKHLVGTFRNIKTILNRDF